MATTFVLFITSPAYKELGPELEKRGASFANTDLPTGVVTSGGRQLTLSTSRARNVAAFDAASAGDGAVFRSRWISSRRCRIPLCTPRWLALDPWDAAPDAGRSLASPSAGSPRSSMKRHPSASGPHSGRRRFSAYVCT